MEPIDVLRALRHRWLLIVAALVVALTAAWVTTPETVQTGPSISYYTATASLLQEPNAEIPLSYVQIFVTRGEIPEQVAEEIDYPGDPAILAAGVSVTIDSETGIMSITASDEVPDQAALVANTFAETTVETVDRIALEDQQKQVAELQRQLRETKAELDQATADLQRRPNDPVAQARQSVLAQQYSAILAQLYAVLGSGGSSAQVRVLQEATPIPVVSGGFAPPSSRSGRLLLGGAVGLALGVLLALVVARLDTRLRTRADIQKGLGLPVVAEVPRVARRVLRKTPVAAFGAPVSAEAEAYRSLRSAVSLMPSRRLAEASLTPEPTSTVDPSNEPRVLIITSTRSAEGKSTTAANLAVTLAETGKQVLLLDADFRHPSLHKLMDVSEGPGLAEVLQGSDVSDLGSFIRPTAAGNVRLITAGDTVDFRGALPSRIRELVTAARGLADVVVVDVAPLLVGNDALDFMPFVDSCIVVCRPGRVSGDQAQRSHDLLRRVGVPVLGVVSVAVRTPRGGIGGSTYGYGYGRSESSRRRGGKKVVKSEAS